MHKYYVHIKVDPTNRGNNWYATVMYGSISVSDRDFLWDILCQISNVTSDSWLVLGDFNAYLTTANKSGGARYNFSSM